MLGMILRRTEEYFHEKGQLYLSHLYRGLFVSAYYGLLRVGELTTGDHPILARDVHIGRNKNKILFILRTSKTHWKDVKPQTVKISGIKLNENRNLCPFNILRQFLNVRQACGKNNEPFFIFKDGRPVKPINMRNVLRDILKLEGFRAEAYCTHSFRIGMASDLLGKNFSVETIKNLGGGGPIQYLNT